MLAEIATAAMTMAAFIEAIGVVWGGDSDLGTGHPGTCRPANDGTVIHDVAAVLSRASSPMPTLWDTRLPRHEQLCMAHLAFVFRRQTLR
ncbi:unnamed protein product (mitochondrion) [Plasmodiophora brassicae]|uniref:Uncharacterized protein n=1 Tax=Plasmodiophora brassicae TaxID=37360 RepID=A0A3P3YFL2_PLABS|nr:unnamed protein product [Plasmodiophora brassicae]